MKILTYLFLLLISFCSNSFAAGPWTIGNVVITELASGSNLTSGTATATFNYTKGHLLLVATGNGGQASIVSVTSGGCGITNWTEISTAADGIGGAGHATVTGNSGYNASTSSAGCSLTLSSTGGQVIQYLIFDVTPAKTSYALTTNTAAAPIAAGTSGSVTLSAYSSPYDISFGFIENSTTANTYTAGTSMQTLDSLPSTTTLPTLFVEASLSPGAPTVVSANWSASIKGAMIAFELGLLPTTAYAPIDSGA